MCLADDRIAIFYCMRILRTGAPLMWPTANLSVKLITPPLAAAVAAPVEEDDDVVEYYTTHTTHYNLYTLWPLLHLLL